MVISSQFLNKQQLNIFIFCIAVKNVYIKLNTYVYMFIKTIQKFHL